MKDIENYLEKEKIDILLETAKACNFRDYLTLRILWRTGMRISELLSIRPQDLEVHNQVINITKAKGNKQRHVMLDSETFVTLSDYISTTNIPVSRPVFAFSSVWAWKLFKKYARMAGLPDTIHPHTLRHNYAVRMVRIGTDLRSVQMLLGHANLNTTQVYCSSRMKIYERYIMQLNFKSIAIVVSCCSIDATLNIAQTELL